jgi:hypothetical protein
MEEGKPAIIIRKGDVIQIPAGFSFFQSLFQLTITCKPVSCRLMDVEQVNIIYPKTFKSFVNSVRIFVFRRPELCSKKNLLAVDSAFFESPSNCALIHIGVCSVDKAVAHLKSLTGAVLGIFR